MMEDHATDSHLGEPLVSVIFQALRPFCFWTVCHATSRASQHMLCHKAANCPACEHVKVSDVDTSFKA